MRKPSKTYGRYASKNVRAFGGIRSSLRFARRHDPRIHLFMRLGRIFKRLHKAVLEATESVTDLLKATEMCSSPIDYTDHNRYEA